jgi:hypothetical protein
MWLARHFTLPLFVLALLALAGMAQTQSAPLVVFVEEPDLQTAAVTDNGADGLTRLAEFFRQQGAETSFIRLDTPIPAEAQVVVLVRPRRALTPFHLSRLWLHLARGGNLLLALDPVGQGGTPDARNSGLDLLLGLEYGIRLHNGLIVEPWSTSETIRDVRLSNVYVLPEDSDHPVIAPLRDYGVPVMLWGARNLHAEFFTPAASAQALLYTEPGFAETNTQVYREQDAAPLVLNIGADAQGRLTVAALAENLATQSRIAVLGDGEMVQNGFGLAPIGGSDIPLHPGDYLLSQRLAAWLLELPVEVWQPLPTSYTWVAIDGDAADWDDQAATTGDTAGDASDSAHDLQQVRTFRNQDYLYLLLETAAPPVPQTSLELQVDANGDGQIDSQIRVDIQQNVFLHVESLSLVSDAWIARGQSVEVKLPLRLIGAASAIQQLCLSQTPGTAAAGEPDCIENVALPVVERQDPAGMQIRDTPLATIRTTDIVNLRAGPGTNFDVLSRFRNGEVLAAIGRNEAGDWIRIQSARYQGWVSASLLDVNTDVPLLPVFSPPE